jgi:hypothetical protein
VANHSGRAVHGDLATMACQFAKFSPLFHSWGALVVILSPASSSERSSVVLLLLSPWFFSSACLKFYQPSDRPTVLALERTRLV